ncbi:acyl-CoA N-acyltransferase [Scenedesmus sp. NREL 46B-D3]|nr:acyl-CoA N-acyltransferase [Scenedesmus sp. NREL 46B-D3]
MYSKRREFNGSARASRVTAWYYKGIFSGRSRYLINIYCGCIFRVRLSPYSITRSASMGCCLSPALHHRRLAWQMQSYTVHSCKRNVRVDNARGGTGQHASYTLRPPLPTDVPRLAAIEQQCGELSAQWSAADIEDELNKGISRVLVAADDSSGDALGYIAGWLVAGELQVLELAVGPAHQSKGIGSALLARLMRQCGCDVEGVEVVLEVKAHNTRAIGLYRNMGLLKLAFVGGTTLMAVMRCS